MKSKDIKKLMKKKTTKKTTIKTYLSTGSTMLNLACSGRPLGGFLKGCYYFLVGDSASGKTFLSLTCLAEAAKNRSFDDYRFIYDNSEGGALMDIRRFFGKEVAERMEAPNVSKKYSNHPHSTTIEEFYFNIHNAVKAKKPFIYILDSMDSLSSEDEISKFDENKKAYEKGTKATGSYGDGKAKKNSAGIRRLLTPLRESGSILLVINQTRDNLGFGFEKKTRSGGNALRFYAGIEIWSSIAGQIFKTIKGKKRQLGINCICQIKKNRVNGKLRKVIMPIYHEFGIDDVGSCVDYLIDEEHWVMVKSKIRAKEFKIIATRDKIIKYIEKHDKEKELQLIVGDVWDEIEDACSIKRKKRYD